MPKNHEWQPSSRAIRVAGDWLEEHGWMIWFDAKTNRTIRNQLRTAIQKAWEHDHA